MKGQILLIQRFCLKLAYSQTKLHKVVNTHKLDILKALYNLPPLQNLEYKF